MADLFGHPETIPCLSLWQPWGSLMVAGFKRRETRHWPTNVRGLCALHAAKTVDADGAPEELCEFALGADWPRTVPRGAVIAVGRLTACYPTAAIRESITCADYEAGNYSDGRFAFLFEDVRPLAEPIPTLGRQGFFRWTPPEDLDARLLPAVDHFEASRRYAEACRGGGI